MEPSKRLKEQEEELEGRYTSHLEILEPVKEDPRIPPFLLVPKQHVAKSQKVLETAHKCFCPKDTF